MSDVAWRITGYQTDVEKVLILLYTIINIGPLVLLGVVDIPSRTISYSGLPTSSNFEILPVLLLMNRTGILVNSIDMTFQQTDIDLVSHFEISMAKIFEGCVNSRAGSYEPIVTYR